MRNSAAAPTDAHNRRSRAGEPGESLFRQLDIFVRALAGALGNMSLVLLPLGGVYLGGGLRRAS